MPSDLFYFKHFVVRQDSCAMKVGTDSMLLGGYTPTRKAQSVLDIGTGTGVLALMLAQRTNAQIDAIEIDRDAYTQAEENIMNSIWRKRIRLFHTSLQAYLPGIKYDLVVSNPPYFTPYGRKEEKGVQYDVQRHMARGRSELTFAELFSYGSKLLAAGGKFYMIVPASEKENVLAEAAANGLVPFEILYIRSKPDSAAVRIIAGFSFQPGPLQENELVIYSAKDVFSPEYIRLTKEYHAMDLERKGRPI